ncbi:MAG: WD40 repeat protein [Candidatus Omnitrophota bacterium]
MLAMATSPWAPLLAVAGQDHVRLIHTETEAELGKLPFPEGVPHVIRFSRNGSVLMVAGGQPVQRGSVVLYDVKSGQRLASFGDEIDAVLAADLSPDQQLVALGGSGQIVKVYSTVNAALVYKLEKHTDWITSLAFSPDGQKLATADRAGGIHLWDATSGGILLSLGEHKASVRGMDWRADSKILASVGDDGLVIWWDVKDGWPAITKPNAHPPVRPKGVYGTLPNGVLAVTFGSDGSLLTVGRNQTAQRWDADGKPIWRQATSENALPIQAAMVQNNQGQGLIVGDSVGQLKFWQVDQ